MWILYYFLSKLAQHNSPFNFYPKKSSCFCKTACPSLVSYCGSHSCHGHTKIKQIKNHLAASQLLWLRGRHLDPSHWAQSFSLSSILWGTCQSFLVQAHLRSPLRLWLSQVYSLASCLLSHLPADRAPGSPFSQQATVSDRVQGNRQEISEGPSPQVISKSFPHNY